MFKPKGGFVKMAPPSSGGWATRTGYLTMTSHNAVLPDDDTIAVGARCYAARASSVAIDGSRATEWAKWKHFNAAKATPEGEAEELSQTGRSAGTPDAVGRYRQE